MSGHYEDVFPGVLWVKILEAGDKELAEISQERVLGLSVGEMRQIRDHFKREKRNPTDVELEAFAQSWSEHCCYKTSKPILQKTIFTIKNKSVICAISEDAAVIDFDKEHAYVVKIESHNHPSALDPYGGAATGIGGILRDVVCMGAQPLALVDPLFFGPLDFPPEKIPAGTKHPKYLMDGVVSGIADYGNRVGIPTVAGMIAFDESYVVNCLVNVGCLGIVKKKNVVHSRAGAAGDAYVMAGGKTGRDGIHGVSFASAELTKESEEESRPAVQLGYAIMKEPLMHACLEANEKGLLTGLKDFGGGGLSCVSSEMAHAAGLGAEVNLDEVELKEPNMRPWEIWVSESQERMMMSVKPKNVKKVLEIFDFWDVPAKVVGTVDKSKRIRAKYKGKTVLDLDLEFLLAGVCYNRPYRIVDKNKPDPYFALPDLEETALSVLNSANVGSREVVIRRYDHEVRGNTIIKPLQGVINLQSHGDAAVIKPLPKSYQGLALTCDVNPRLCKLDPYWGSASAVDEVVRNLVSVGALPHSMVDCLNFANPEKPERFGDFVRSTEGLHYVASVLNFPFVSGNVSLYNESAFGPIAPTPTLFGVGIVDDVRKCVTSDLKKEGNLLYLVGDTQKELGGSVYYHVLRLEGGVVPRVDPKKTKKLSNDMLSAIKSGLVRSCHDLSEGGLLACAAEMALGGDTGFEIDVSGLCDLRFDSKLFSESNTRWLVEVPQKNAKKFEKKIGALRVGRVTGGDEMIFIDGSQKLELPITKARQKWGNSIGREE